jgi:predicted phage tail protein
MVPDTAWMSFVVRVLNVIRTSPAAFPTSRPSPPAEARVTGAVQLVLFAARVAVCTALSSSEPGVAHIASALPELSITMLGSPGVSLRMAGLLQLPPGGKMLP